MGVVSYRPDRSEFAWTFGGVPPVRKVKPGDVLELWTEDAFGGKVRGVDDLVSRVIESPFVNPHTGRSSWRGRTRRHPGHPLHLDRALPGMASSCTVPLFGALTSTHQTAALQEPLPEVVWIYEVEAAKRTVTYRARAGEYAVELPLEPDARDGRSGTRVVRGPDPRWFPMPTAATWTRPRCAPGRRAIWG